MLDSRQRTAHRSTASSRGLRADTALVLGVLLLLGLAAGLVWPQLVDPVVFTRTADGIVSNEVALAEQFDADGWYVVLAATAGVLAGVVLTLWRDRDPVATVVLLLLGSCLAAWVMKEVGTALGPPDVRGVLQDAGVGTTAPDRVAVRATAAYAVWPMATLLGAVAVLWTRRASHEGVQ